MSRQNSREISNINVTLNGHEIGIDRVANGNQPFSDVKVLCVRGANGNGIASIEKTATSGNVDTYTITFDDGDTTTFTVTNGVIAVDETLSPTSENAIMNKTVDAAFKALDGAITGTPSTAKTLSAFSQTDGKVTATFANIAITKSQVTDFPSSMPANGGTATKVSHTLDASVYAYNESEIGLGYNGETETMIDFMCLNVPVSVGNWSGTVDSDGYYTNIVSFGNNGIRANGFLTYWRPQVALSIADWTADTEPTAAESAAFSCVNQFKFAVGTDIQSMTVRAKTKPTSTFYVTVQGIRLRSGS